MSDEDKQESLNSLGRAVTHLRFLHHAGRSGASFRWMALASLASLCVIASLSWHLLCLQTASSSLLRSQVSGSVDVRGRVCPPSVATLDAGQWLPCPSDVNVSAVAFKDPSASFSSSMLQSNHIRNYCHSLHPDSPFFMNSAQYHARTHNFDHEARQFFQTFEPVARADKCRLVYHTSAEARRLLANKRLLFIGDSTMQEMVTELIAFLEGSPLRMDFMLEAWWHQQRCGGSQSYQYRNTMTSKFPSPALSTFNISIGMLWNGHVEECGNWGDCGTMLRPEWQFRLFQHSQVCMNRTAHLLLLGRLFDIPRLVDDVFAYEARHDDAYKERMALFDAMAAQLHSSTGDHPLLLDASNKLFLRANVKEILTLIEHCVPPAPSSTAFFDTLAAMIRYNYSDFDLLTLPAPLSTFDYIVFNNGAHYHGSWTDTPPSDRLQHYSDVLYAMFSQLHSMAPALIWKDSTPMYTHRHGFFHLNSIARAVAKDFEQPGAGSKHIHWPVVGMLNDLRKEDFSHCSFKDRKESDFKNREREVRTVWCHQAIQLLLQLISNHQQEDGSH